MKQPHIPDTEIALLDLTTIIKQLRSSVGSFRNWSATDVNQLAHLYRMFLYLCKKYPNQKITPTREVDLFWHQHILNTEKYANDCSRTLGFFLQHYPEKPQNIKKNPRSKTNRQFLHTLDLVQKEFYPCKNPVS